MKRSQVKYFLQNSPVGPSYFIVLQCKRHFTFPQYIYCQSGKIRESSMRISNLYTHIQEYSLIHLKINEKSNSNTSPERNLSTMMFMVFRDILFSPAWTPTRKSLLHCLRSLSFCRMYDRDLAVTILFTKIIHFMFFCNLSWNM